MTRISIFAAMLFATWSARGESFTPESAAVVALLQNKDLAAASFLIAEAEGRLIQAGLWKNLEFKMDGEHSTRRSDGDWKVTSGFMQRFPLAGRLAMARTVARVDVAMAIEELRDRERLLAGQVLGKTRSRLVLDRKLEINGQNRALLERILQQTASLSATGKAGTADALVIELEQKRLDLARDALMVERRAVSAELNGLLGRAPGADLFIRGALSQIPPLQVLKHAAEAALALRPDRRLVALQVDKSHAEEMLARAEKWEDVGVGLEVSRERDENMHDTMAGLGFSVPLPLWNRNQGRVAETRAAQQRASAEVAARDLAIATEVREAQTRLIGLGSILDKTRGPVLDLARRNTELLEQTYASGTASFLMIFESQKQRLMLEDNAIETERSLVSALTDWETRTMQFPAPVLAAMTGPGGERSGRR